MTRAEIMAQTAFEMSTTTLDALDMLDFLEAEVLAKAETLRWSKVFQVTISILEELAEEARDAKKRIAKRRKEKESP